jgi:hypothetical protein
MYFIHIENLLDSVQLHKDLKILVVCYHKKTKWNGYVGQGSLQKINRDLMNSLRRRRRINLYRFLLHTLWQVLKSVRSVWQFCFITFITLGRDARISVRVVRIHNEIFKWKHYKNSTHDWEVVLIFLCTFIWKVHELVYEYFLQCVFIKITF